MASIAAPWISAAPRAWQGLRTGFGDDGVAEADECPRRRMDDLHALQVEAIAMQRLDVGVECAHGDADIDLVTQHAQRLGTGLRLLGKAVQPGMDDRLHALRRKIDVVGAVVADRQNDLLQHERNAVRPVEHLLEDVMRRDAGWP